MKTQGIFYSVSAVLSGGTCSINATALQHIWKFKCLLNLVLYILNIKLLIFCFNPLLKMAKIGWTKKLKFK